MCETRTVGRRSYRLVTRRQAASARERLFSSDLEGLRVFECATASLMLGVESGLRNGENHDY